VHYVGSFIWSILRHFAYFVLSVSNYIITKRHNCHVIETHIGLFRL